MKWNPVGVIALLVTLLAPASAWAQLSTAGVFPQGPLQTMHPIKTVYNSPDEWPLFDGQVPLLGVRQLVCVERPVVRCVPPIQIACCGERRFGKILRDAILQ